MSILSNPSHLNSARRCQRCAHRYWLAGLNCAFDCAMRKKGKRSRQILRLVGLSSQQVRTGSSPVKQPQQNKNSTKKTDQQPVKIGWEWFKQILIKKVRFKAAPGSNIDSNPVNKTFQPILIEEMGKSGCICAWFKHPFESGHKWFEPILTERNAPGSNIHSNPVNKMFQPILIEEMGKSRCNCAWFKHPFESGHKWFEPILIEKECAGFKRPFEPGQTGLNRVETEKKV